MMDQVQNGDCLEIKKIGENMREDLSLVSY